MPGSPPTGPTPLTVVGGFLGSGKTTLLNHLIRHAGGRRFGVLVNDFGEINIDADLIVGIDENVVALQGGCICCSMRGDLREALFSMLEMSPPPEHIIVETSGVSEPQVVRDFLVELDRSGVLRLDGIVTIVDATNFPPQSEDSSRLAKSQIAAADLILINKIDLVPKERADEVEAILESSAPKVRTENAVLPLSVVLGLEHDIEAPIESAGIDAASHFETLSFRSEAVLSFKKLAPLLTQLPSLIRAKGVVTAEERPGAKVIVHAVGHRLHARTLPLDESAEPSSVLVFIFERGTLDREKLLSDLKACEHQV